MARLLANGRPQHIPSQTDTVVRFVQEHVAVFLRLCELVKRGATMATTRNGAAQGVDGGVCSEHTVLFLHPSNFGIRNTKRLLRLTTFLRC